jgi:hypothetical protein
LRDLDYVLNAAPPNPSRGNAAVASPTAADAASSRHDKLHDEGWNPLATRLRRLAEECCGIGTSSALLEIAEDVELREAESSSAYESVGLLMKALGHGGGHGALTIECIERMQKAEEALTKSATSSASEKLAALGAWTLEEMRGDHIGADLDGGAFQDKAEALGILEYVDVTEPCGEVCNCAEYDDFPQKCLRYTDEIRAAIASSDRTACPECGDTKQPRPCGAANCPYPHFHCGGQK